MAHGEGEWRVRQEALRGSDDGGATAENNAMVMMKGDAGNLLNSIVIPDDRQTLSQSSDDVFSLTVEAFVDTTSFSSQHRHESQNDDASQIQLVGDHNQQQSSDQYNRLDYGNSPSQQQQLEEATTTNLQTTSSISSQTTQSAGNIGGGPERSGTSDKISTRMGYNDPGEHSSWTFDEDGKMDSRTHEDKNRDGDDSTVQSTAVMSTGSIHDGDGDHLSPASSPRISPTLAPANAMDEAGGANQQMIGTPSTVSTAPSTEDASLSDSIDKIGLKLDPNQLEPFTLHRRAPSWDRSPMSRNLYANTEISAANTNMQPTLHQIPSIEQSQKQYWGMPPPPPQQQQQVHPAPSQAQAQAYAHQQLHATVASSPWGNPLGQSRVASFRPEQSGVPPEVNKHDPRAGYTPSYGQVQVPPQHQAAEHHAQQSRGWQQQPTHQPGNPFHHQQPHPHQQQAAARGGLHMHQHQEGMGYHRQQGPAAGAAGGYNPYHQVQQHHPHPRKSGYPPQHQQPPTAQSPARAARATRGAPGAPSPHRGPPNQPSLNASSAGGGGGGSSRSSSEILKTLLRKKACLYEPDTSRAVALVTWLVGRELALEYGYFSRQQLQAGVHACVAEKIDSGTITRTKVNRCMQIILNSCFHYIIPRPDGTEEKGHRFRATFEKEVYNDVSLLELLPEPWNDLHVDRQKVLDAADGDLKSVSEPRSAPGTPHSSPKVKPKEHPRPSPKRDTARSQQQHHDHHGGEDSKRAVLLCFNENVRAAEDVFRCHNEFIRDSAHSSNLQLTAQEWRIFFGKEAASAPYIWGNVGIPVVAVETAKGERRVDVLGQMTPVEAGKFRTTWCAKRYDHDHEFCGMAHVEVNGGWLRRDPNLHTYKDELCPFIVKTADKRIGPNYFVINECPNGVNCEFAHSHEEIIYHPNRYKKKACPSIMRTGTCRYGDICPHHHPSDSARPPKKGDGRPPSSRHGRAGGQSSSSGKNTSSLPSGSPILYASPAPFSSYERHLLMPGLQSLFRRQCSVVRAHLRNPKCRCCYSYFGDDAGVDHEAPARPRARPVGLPSHRM